MRGQDSMAAASARQGSSGHAWSDVLGKIRYKFWVLGAILLLAFWSVFTGSVTLKLSAGNINGSDEFDFPISDNLDILEVEEREKVVRHMWDGYSQSKSRLPEFWLEAFDAAYEQLVSDAPAVRNSAVSEIAKLSLRSIQLHPLALHSTKTSKLRKSLEHQKEGRE